MPCDMYHDICLFPKPFRLTPMRIVRYPLGGDQTISQPYIVGYMTSLLNLAAGDKVLEIGTGSGYQAAVLSEITPHVFSIEIVAALGRRRPETDWTTWATVLLRQKLVMVTRDGPNTPLLMLLF
ncbi:MAG: hypothetical protein U5J63_07815 [Fodinibius sp.]|nr:hypothetical protein [Fodinibius sp.]